MRRRIQGEHAHIAAPAHGRVQLHQRPLRVAVDERIGKFKHEIPARRAQHIPGQLCTDLALGERQADVQERQRIAHGALGRTGDFLQGLLAGGASDALQHLFEPGDDGLHGDPMEVEALAAGEDGGGQFLGLGGGQDEYRVARRLLQGLEQGVERTGGEHVHLVDDVDLVFGQRRRILDLVPQLADLVHAVVAGGVDLQHVHAVFLLQGLADFAFAAGIARPGIQTVDRPGEHLGRSGLTGAAGAAEEVGVGDAPGFHLPHQRAHHRVLIAYTRKGIRTPCPVQCLITHRFPSSAKIDGRRAIDPLSLHIIYRISA